MQPQLIDLKLTKKEQAEEAAEPSPDLGQYSWGLQLRLEREELDKLGIVKLPGVGDEWHFMATAKVTNVSQQQMAGGEEDSCVCLQVQMMALLGAESAEEEAGEKETPAAEMAETKSLMAKYGV